MPLATLLREAGPTSHARTFASSITSADGLVPRLVHLFEQWTTPSGSVQQETFVVTHPFHPLFQRKFELVMYRPCWGEDRVSSCDFLGGFLRSSTCRDAITTKKDWRTKCFKT